MFEFIVNGLAMVSYVVALYCLYCYAKEKNLRFSWWKWILCSGWLLALFLLFAFIGTAVGEGEPRAALRGGAIFLAVESLAGAVVGALCFSEALPRFKKTTQKMAQ